MCDIRIELIKDYKETSNNEVKEYIRNLFEEVYGIDLKEYTTE